MYGLRNLENSQQDLRIIRFVIDTIEIGLTVEIKLDNNLGLRLQNFCDSSWAGDPKNSVTDIIIYSLDVFFRWRL
jgi:hypothetical protein